MGNANKKKIVAAVSEPDNLDEVLIKLENGVFINLSLKPKLVDPLFAEIKELSLPKTDGERVYWSNGAALTIDEIIAMLRSEDSG